MNSKIVASARKGIAAAWLVATAAILLTVLYADLTGPGLTSTQRFRVIGYAIYPVFYGSGLWLLYAFGAMLAGAKTYISVTGGTVRVGRRKFALENLRSIKGKRNWIGLREIVFEPADGPTFAVRAYILSRPYNETLAALQEILKPRGAGRST